MAGIKIQLLADVVNFIKGVRNVEESLDDVSDSLDDLAREARSSGDKVENSLEDIGDEGASTASKLENKFKDSWKSVRKGSSDAGKDIGDNINKGAKRANEGVDTLKQNTASNAKEMAGSFTDVESALDGVQGLAAEALEDFGGWGVAVGVGFGAAIGVAINLLQQAADKANKLTEEAAAFAQEIGDADLAAKVSILDDRWSEMLTTINDVRSIWEVWQPRAITNAEQFAKAIDDGAINAQDLMDAFKDPNPVRRIERMKDLTAQLDGRIESLNDQIVRGNGIKGPWDAATKGFQASLDATEAVKGVLADYVAQEEAAIAITEALATAEGLTVDAYLKKQEAIAGTQETEAQYHAALAGMADAQSIYNAALQTNTEATQEWADQQGISYEEAVAVWQEAPLTLDEVLTELSNRVQQQRDFEKNLQDLANRGWGAVADVLRAGGPEVNGAVVAMLAAGTDAQVQQFAADQGYLTGTNLAQGTANAFYDGRVTIKKSVDKAFDDAFGDGRYVKVNADTSDIPRQVQQALNGTYTIKVKGRPIGLAYE